MFPVKYGVSHANQMIEACFFWSRHALHSIICWDNARGCIKTSSGPRELTTLNNINNIFARLCLPATDISPTRFTQSFVLVYSAWCLLIDLPLSPPTKSFAFQWQLAITAATPLRWIVASLQFPAAAASAVMLAFFARSAAGCCSSTPLMLMISACHRWA